jgi:hypothetical protein
MLNTRTSNHLLEKNDGVPTRKNLPLLYSLYSSSKYTMPRRQSVRPWRLWIWLLSLIVACAILGLLYTKRSMFSILHEGYDVQDTSNDNDAPFTTDNLDCYVINLKKNPDRMIQFQTNYEKTDLSHTKSILHPILYINFNLVWWDVFSVI